MVSQAPALRAQGTRADALFLPRDRAGSNSPFSTSLARRLDTGRLDRSPTLDTRGVADTSVDKRLTQGAEREDAAADSADASTEGAESSDEIPAEVSSRDQNDEAGDADDTNEHSDADQAASTSAAVGGSTPPSQPQTIHAVNQSLLDQQDWAREVLSGSRQTALNDGREASARNGARSGDAAGAAGATARSDEAERAKRARDDAALEHTDLIQHADEEGGELTNTTTQRRSQGGWRSSPFEIDHTNRWREGHTRSETGTDRSAAGHAARTDAAPSVAAGSRASNTAADSVGQHANAGSSLAGSSLAGSSLAGSSKSQVSRGAATDGAAAPATDAAKNITKAERGAADGPSAVSPLRALEAQPGVRQLSARFGRPDVRTHPPSDHHAAAQQTPFDAQARAVRAQALRGVAAALSSSEQSVTLKLEPATLGELRVNLQFKEGTVAARFEASSSEARRLLERSIGDLRQALEARGVEVSKLEVQLLPPSDVQNKDGAAQDAPNTRQEAGANAEAFNSNPQGGASAGSQDFASPRDGQRGSPGLNAERSDLNTAAAVSDTDAEIAGQSRRVSRLGLDALA